MEESPATSVTYGPLTRVRRGGKRNPNGSVTFQLDSPSDSSVDFHKGFVNRGGVVLGTAHNTIATGSTKTTYYYCDSSGGHQARQSKMRHVGTDSDDDDSDDSDDSDEGKAPSKHPKSRNQSKYTNDILGSRTVNHYGNPPPQEGNTRSRTKPHRQPAPQQTAESARAESSNASSDDIVSLASAGAPTPSQPEDLADTLMGPSAVGIPSTGRGSAGPSDVYDQNDYETQSIRSTNKKTPSRWGTFGDWFRIGQSNRRGTGASTDSAKRSNNVGGSPSWIVEPDHNKPFGASPKTQSNERGHDRTQPGSNVGSQSEPIMTPASGSSIRDLDHCHDF